MTSPVAEPPAQPRTSRLFVVNERAKGATDAAARAAFVQQIHTRFTDASVVFHGNGGDLDDTVRTAIANGATMVVAAGGDGTVSAIAATLAGTEVTLGVIPLGTYNHFAKDLGIPDETDAAIDVLAAGHVVIVDTGVVNGRLFVNNSGLGLYPDMVVHRDARRKSGAAKWTSAFVATVRALWHYRLLGVRVLVKGESLLRRTPVVFIGNNEYVMETPFAPRRSTMTGGELSLYIPHPRSRIKLVWFTLRAMFGRLEPDGEFDFLAADAFTIESRQRVLRVSLDGEVALMAPPLEYSARRGALRVVVPAPVR